MHKPLLTTLLLTCALNAHAGEEYFYRLTVNACGGNCVKSFDGKSELKPKELEKALEDDGFIKLTELFYFEKDKVKPWSEWDDRIKPEISIRASSVVSYMEYKSNPLKSQSGER